jgi:enamine deaminase RidA (YjgF/YER057c/UK114 family)
MPAESRLSELGVKLIPIPNSAGNYIPARKTGNLVFISGQIPRKDMGGGNLEVQKGKVDKDVSVEAAKECARLCGISILSVLRDAIGDLDKVTAVVKVDGFVNCIDTFTNHPLVVNGCSDLFLEVFGKEVGAHARAAVGCSSLPSNVPVEVAAIFEVRE